MFPKEGLQFSTCSYVALGATWQELTPFFSECIGCKYFLLTGLLSNQLLILSFEFQR